VGYILAPLRGFLWALFHFLLASKVAKRSNPIGAAAGGWVSGAATPIQQTTSAVFDAPSAAEAALQCCFKCSAKAPLHPKPKTGTAPQNQNLAQHPNQKSGTAMTTDVRTTFVPVDVHNLPVLMCNYTGKEVVE
jgi:hypothetical protein